LKDKNINTFKVLFIDKLTADTAIRDLVAIDNITTPDEALIELYKKLRPGEPTTLEAAKTYFENLFFNEKRLRSL